MHKQTWCDDQTMAGYIHGMSIGLSTRIMKGAGEPFGGRMETRISRTVH